MMPPTITGGNVLNRMSNRFSKRSRTPTAMQRRDTRIMQSPMNIGAGTGSTVFNNPNNTSTGGLSAG
jgi:hypothetical protein